MPVADLNLPNRHLRETKRVKAEILEQEEGILAAYIEKSKTDFLTFARGIRIASARGPRVFECCIAPFQRRCFESIAPHLEALQRGDMPDMRRWWIERTKKASKDADLAIILLWLIAFTDRPFYMEVGAANKEQAAIIKERMLHLLHWNPWLDEYVEIVKWEARSVRRISKGTESMVKLNIRSSDIAGAHGGTPDLLIINELSHVTKWEFAENLMDNADGVAQGMVIIATNAGFKGTKAEVWRNNAITSEDWEVHVWSKPAPWHDKKTIADAAARNSASRQKRLWHGIWASGKGDALSEEAIDRAFSLRGPMIEVEPGWLYIGGLDLGITHDHSGLVVLAVNFREQKIKTVWWKSYAPRVSTGEVDLQLVESDCVKVQEMYNLQGLFYDPTECRLMAQRLRIRMAMRPWSFSSPKNLTLMAESLIQVVEAGKLECYDDEEGTLRRDFGKFNIVEKAYGYKLEAVSDEFGHADVGTALVIALPAAMQILDGFSGLSPMDDVTDTNDEDLSKEEVEGMPDELREIYEMDEDDLGDHVL